MKKQKLKLNDLNVSSFSTNLDENQRKTIGGGAVSDITPIELRSSIDHAS